MNERLNEIVLIKCKGNKAKLAQEIGMAHSTCHNYLSGDRKLSFEFVTAILRAYPDISAEWLLRGDGGMFKTNDVITNSPIYNDHGVVASAPHAHAEVQQESKNGELMEQIAKLTETVAGLQRQNEMLIKKVLEG